MLRRTEALVLLAQAHPQEPKVVTCGAASRELAAVAAGRNCHCVVGSRGLATGLEASRVRKVVG